MNSNQEDVPFLLDLSGTKTLLEAIKVYFRVPAPFQTSNKNQEILMSILEEAHIPKNISDISFDGTPFSINDQEIKSKGLCTYEYLKYVDYVQTLYGGKDVTVAALGSNSERVLYTCINNLVTSNFRTTGTATQYKSRDKKSLIDGFYINSSVLPISSPEDQDEFDIAGVICDPSRFVAFFMPRDDNFAIHSMEEFLVKANQIVSLDLIAENKEESWGIDYPLIKDLEVQPNLKFLKHLNGFSERFNDIVEIGEFKQKNKFNLDENGAQFESTSSASIMSRSLPTTRFTIDRSFFCVIYSQQGKPMNISYIPGHLFLKPV